jgi:hypothetical protein
MVTVHVFNPSEEKPAVETENPEEDKSAVETKNPEEDKWHQRICKYLDLYDFASYI